MGEGGSGTDIVQEVIAYGECGVVAPALWVANLGLKQRQLLQGALLGSFGHPRQFRDALPVGCQEIVHQLQHLLFVGRREMLRDVETSHIVAHRALDEAHGSLPAIALLRGALQSAPVELKILLRKFLWEIGGARPEYQPQRP